jgi:hypothetical protein
MSKMTNILTITVFLPGLETDAARKLGYLKYVYA